MNVAARIAERSRCDGAQIGAVIVDRENRVISTGYNGPPRGFDDSAGPTCVSWCPRQKVRQRVYDAGREGITDLSHLAYGLNCPSVHAEANALMFADRSEWQGGTIYVTGSICADCAKLVAQSGLSRVVQHVDPVRDAHRDPQSVMLFLQDCGIDVSVV